MYQPIDENYMMPYGKHKGTPLNGLPSDYLQWFAKKLSEPKLPGRSKYAAQDAQILHVVLGLLNSRQHSLGRSGGQLPSVSTDAHVPRGYDYGYDKQHTPPVKTPMAQPVQAVVKAASERPATQEDIGHIWIKLEAIEGLLLKHLKVEIKGHTLTEKELRPDDTLPDEAVGDEDVPF